MKNFILPVLTALFAALPSVSAGYADNANELTDGSACRAVSVVYARGTDESGNIGKAGLIGPVLFDALAALLPAGSMAVQGVAGEFSIATFLKGGDADAAAVMTDLVLSTAERCPDTKIIMAGYSQGAQVLHEAANSDLFMVNPLLVNHVVAYLTFGDPDKDIAYSLVNNLSKAVAPDAAKWLVERINAGFKG